MLAALGTAGSPVRAGAFRDSQMRTAEQTREKGRLKAAKYKANHPERLAANRDLLRALARGEIHRQPCFLCGDTLVSAHHPDYSAPFDVLWLCNGCHSRLRYKSQEVRDAVEASEHLTHGSSRAFEVCLNDYQRRMVEPDPRPTIELDDFLWAGLSKLRLRDALIIIWRFGIWGVEPETLEQVGERFGVTRELIRVREADALRKLAVVFARMGRL